MTVAVGSAVGRAVRRGGGIAAAMAVMNVATYAYTIVAARRLGPQAYGAFAALMGLVLVISVVQLGLQATGARRISAAPGDVDAIERSVLRVARRAAAVVGGVCLLATPLIDALLNLDSLASAALVAVTAVPMTHFGGQAGVLQGERRWSELAAVYLANGVPRLVIGSVLLLWSTTEFVAMLAVALGQVVPVLVGWWVLRRPRAAAVPRAGDDRGAAARHGGREVLVEMVHNSHALLAFFALSNVDILVARSALDPRQAGLYAAGFIVVKAVLFLPQFVVVIAFPSMASGEARRRVLLVSLAAVAVLGVACTVGARALSGLALVFVGGEQYAAVEGRLWLFAVLGTLLALLQLLVYSVLARQARRAVLAIWAALVAVAVLGPSSAGHGDLVELVVAVDATLFAVLLGGILWRLRRG